MSFRSPREGFAAHADREREVMPSSPDGILKVKRAASRQRLTSRVRFEAEEDVAAAQCSDSFRGVLHARGEVALLVVGWNRSVEELDRARKRCRADEALHVLTEDCGVAGLLRSLAAADSAVAEVQAGGWYVVSASRTTLTPCSSSI